jgi:hypothetical protein
MLGCRVSVGPLLLIKVVLPGSVHVLPRTRGSKNRGEELGELLASASEDEAKVADMFV